MNTPNPVCLTVQPKSLTQGLSVNFVITGYGDDQVTFTAMQDNQQLEKIIGERDKTLTLNNRGNKPVELCWSKNDRKSKLVNFLISDPH